jgi:hypothetical protein
LADDVFAASGDAAHAMIIVAAVFAWFIARAFIAERGT